MSDELVLEEFKGFSVVIKTNTKGREETLAGRVEEATRLGVILRLKGTPRAVLIEKHEISSIVLDRAVTDIKQALLQRQTLKTVRKHLASHHGVALSVVNAMLDNEAWDHHEELHKSPLAFDMGHSHPEKTVGNNE